MAFPSKYKHAHATIAGFAKIIRPRALGQRDDLCLSLLKTLDFVPSPHTAAVDSVMSQADILDVFRPHLQNPSILSLGISIWNNSYREKERPAYKHLTVVIYTRVVNIADEQR